MTSNSETGFEPAPDWIVKVYKRLLDKWSDISFLRNYNLILLLKVKPTFQKGRKVLGRAKICSAEDFQIHGYHAKIILDLEFAEENRGNPEQLEALIYHELCHLEEKEEGDGLIPAEHDFAEFYRVLLRYGDWTGEIAQAEIQLQKNRTGVETDDGLEQIEDENTDSEDYLDEE